MRYLGNKKSLLENIDDIVSNFDVVEGARFVDGFAGTGTVGAYFSNRFDVISNDKLLFSSMLSSANVVALEDYSFSKLSEDPFVVFNSAEIEEIDFVTKTYTPYGGRMFFSEENGRRIDGIRNKIEYWFTNGEISQEEKYYLVACLLEGVSKTANIAGVYGAYLKTWDPRAVKVLRFEPLPENVANKHSYKSYQLDVIELMNVLNLGKGDVLYLDPPYTNAQYSKQYHLPETIARWDKPNVKGVAGLPVREDDDTSLWSRDGYSHLEFEKLIANTNAEHIILSYSSAGHMSDSFIENVLKRHGVADTLVTYKIPYKKYLNTRTGGKNDNNEVHYEYLFYVRKDANVKQIYASPINYTGNKTPIMSWIREETESLGNLDTVYDLFGGGLNAGINLQSNKIVYNDINNYVSSLFKWLEETDTVTIYRSLKQSIKKYGLSSNNKEAYNKLREDYNKKKPELRDNKLLMLCIFYGFQNQLRFNSKHDFNNPVGLGSFNDSLVEKLFSFSRVLKEKEVTFSIGNYSDAITLNEVKKNDLVYLDPPYLITLGSYNDGKRGFNGWTKEHEKDFLLWLDKLVELDIKFILSNVIEHKGNINEQLQNWVIENENSVIVVDYTGKASRGRKEVVIKNFK